MKKRGEGDSGITVSSLIGLIVGLLIFVPFLLYGCKVYNQSRECAESVEEFKKSIENLNDDDSDYIPVCLERGKTLVAFDRLELTTQFSSELYYGDNNLNEEKFRDFLRRKGKSGISGDIYGYLDSELVFKQFKRPDFCKSHESCLCICDEIGEVGLEGGVLGEKILGCVGDRNKIKCQSFDKNIFVRRIGLRIGTLDYSEPLIYKFNEDMGYKTFYAEHIGSTIYVCEEEPCYLKFECSDYNADTCLSKNGCYVGVDGKCASCSSDKYLGCAIYGEKSCIPNLCKIEPGCTYDKKLGDEKGKCLPTSPGFIEYD